MNSQKCVVLVPVANRIEPDCDAALRELERRGYDVWRVPGFAAIDQARNQLATDALAAGFDETMWIDSDIKFHPDDVTKLRAHELPISCAIYPKKGVRELAVHVLPGTEMVVFGQDGGLLEIKYAGTGFLLIRRAAYLAIKEKLSLPECNRRFGRPMIPFFMPLIVPDELSPWYLAEDFAFCERARQAGLKVMADSSIRLGHIGTHAFTWEDAGDSPKRFQSYRYRLT
jgi:hypothetical protein